MSGIFRHHAAMEFLAQPAIDVGRQLHAGCGQGIDGRAKTGQRVDEGMDGAAALEIAGNRDLHVLKTLLLRAQREQVAQRLCRMLVAAVAAVDHGNLRIFGCQARRAVARMADDDDVGIVGNDPDCVGEAFALGRGTHRRIGAGDIGATQAQHGALERQARAGGRLIEQARQDGFGRQIGAPPDPVMDFGVGQFLQKPVRDLEDRLDLRIGEVIDRNQMACQRLGFAHQSGAIGPIRAVRQASIQPASPVCTGIHPRLGGP